MHLHLRRVAVGAVVVAAALVAAPPALGQTSAQDGYSAPAGSVQQQVPVTSDSRHEVAAKSSSSSTSSSGLPFTGLDVALLFAASGVLLAMGISIRRLSRRQT
jgi:hypothetical protein